MKQIPVLALALVATPCVTSAQYVINDPGFLSDLQDAVPAALTGNVLDTLHPDVISLSTLDASSSDDIDGIRFFVNLEALGLNYSTVDTLLELPNSLRSIDLDWLEYRLRKVDRWPDSLRHLSFRNDWYWNPGTAQQDIGLIDTLPPLLEYLDLYGHTLDTLPALPTTLRHLDVQRNLQLTALPALPNALLHLNVSQTDIPALPVFPDSLMYLSCGSNLHLAMIGPLPAGLKELHVTTVVPMLPDLPALPEGLEVLEYGGTTLGSTIPTLPSTLRELLLNNLNNVTVVPDLPHGLQRLQATAMNNVAQLPALPTTLTVLNTENSLFDCYPYVPSSVTEWKVSTNTGCIPNLPPDLNNASNADDFPICTVVTSPDCPTTEGVTGHIFIDADGDGVRDAGEAPFPAAMVLGTPGTHLAGADADGRYMLALDTGDFIVDGADLAYAQRTTAPYAVHISAPLQVDSLVDIGYQLLPGASDLRVVLSASDARPGFGHVVQVTVVNDGPFGTDGTLQVTLEPAFTYLSADPMPDDVNGNVLSLSLMNVLPGMSRHVHVQLNVPVDIPIGTPGMHTAVLSIPDEDPTPGNNGAQLHFVVVGAYDPNDKRVIPSLMSMEEVQGGTPLEYTIRFQNTGTYLAERVVITDTLQMGLMAGSSQFIGSSHDCSWYLDDDVLVVIFDGINLPDSTSDEPNSHGFVRFGIRPDPDLIAGDQVANTANIYFDFNEPVITVPAVFTVELQTPAREVDAPALRLAPNPAQDIIILRFPAPVANADLRVTDSAGRTVHQGLVSGTSSALSTGRWAPGVYLVRLRGSNGLWAVRLVRR